jgi:hypothetical protein
VLMTASWPRIQKHVPDIVDAISRAQGGGYIEVVINR